MTDPDGVGSKWFEAWQGNPLGQRYVEVDYCGNAFVVYRERAASGGSAGRLKTTVYYFPGWLIQVLIRSGYTRSCENACKAARNIAFDAGQLYDNVFLGPGDIVCQPVDDVDSAQPSRLIVTDSRHFARRDGAGYRIDIQSSRWSAWARDEGGVLVPEVEEWSPPRMACTAVPGVEIQHRPILNDVLDSLRQPFLQLNNGWREASPATKTAQALDLRIRRTATIAAVAQARRPNAFVDTELEMAQTPPGVASATAALDSGPPQTSSFSNRQTLADGFLYLIYPKSALQGTVVTDSMYSATARWGNALASWLTANGHYSPGVDVAPLALIVKIDPLSSRQRFAIRIRPLTQESLDDGTNPTGFDFDVPAPATDWVLLDAGSGETVPSDWVDRMPSQPPFFRVEVVRTAGVELTARLDSLIANPAEMRNYVRLHESVVDFDEVPDDPESIDLSDLPMTDLRTDYDPARAFELLQQSGDDIDRFSMILGFTPLDPLCDLYDFANLLSYAARGSDIFGRRMDRLDAIAAGIGLLPCISGGLIKSARGMRVKVLEGSEWISRGTIAGSFLTQGVSMMDDWDRTDDDTLMALAAAADPTDSR